MKRVSLLALAAALACSSMRAADAPPLAQVSGAELFSRLCTSCHGNSGRGDGPVAPALKVPVPDLTRIGTRDGGFPEERVYDMIDGRAMIPAHGTRDMPVWGYELEAGVSSDMPGRASAQTMIERLVDYLRSIQEPAAR
jgi:mono/diheme cytochrome c family protein